MSKIIIRLGTGLLLLLGVTNIALSDVYFNWLPAFGDWATGANWDQGYPPTSGSANTNSAIVNTGVCNVTSNQGSDRLFIGYDDNGAVQPCTVHVSAGINLNVRYNLEVGRGILNMNGTAYAEQLGSSGAINVADGGWLTIGWWGCYVGMSGTGTINLNGTANMTVYGNEETTGGLPGITMSGNGHIDIEDGTLSVLGDRRTQLQGYIDNGWITAYDGTGTVNAASYNADTGYTTVTAISSPGTTTNVVTIKEVNAASEHSSGGYPAVNTINGSGMTGDYHDMMYSNMWITNPGGGGAENPNPGTEPGATWIKYEFDKLYTLISLWVWNYNGDPCDDVTDRGLKNVTIEYTSDGVNWHKLDNYVFNKATHEDAYAHNTTIYFNNAVAKEVVITAKGGVGTGNWEAADTLYGLSEVRLYGTAYTNPYASEPNPVSGAAGVSKATVLSWRVGAYAADVNGHDVYLGTDYNSVANANHSSDEFIGRQTATSYDPCGLASGQTYYWRIDEVNSTSLWPGNVWSFTVRVKPKMKLNRGITLDRQFTQIPPEGIMTILPADIQIIKSMGFEFVKLLVNPDCFISGSTINSSNMWYLDEIVDRVLAEGLPVVVCIHPMSQFKYDYLGNWPQFQNLLWFYEDFAAYMAARWDSNELAFQLMTEPFGNAWDWNTMQPLMWQAVRNGMPNHTLILSGDQVGQISGLINVAPVNDDNVYYCFTTYDPVIFTLQGSYWIGGWWPYLGRVPYPSSPSIVAAAMPTILANIPDQYKADVQNQVTTYGNEYWGKAKQQAQMQQVVNWNASHGGNLKVWCAEFGVLDPVVGGWSGGGVIPEDYYEFLRDLREAMEEDRIGWAYWSYNETFTVLNPNLRAAFSKSPSYNWIDETMLHALGMRCGEGDINCDDVVDYNDLAVLAGQWLQHRDFPPYADIAPSPNGDDMVNFLDFVAVAEHWLENVAP